MDKNLLIDSPGVGTPARYTLNRPLSEVQKECALAIQLAIQGNRSEAGIDRDFRQIAAEPGRIFNFYSISHLYEGCGFYWREGCEAKLLSPGACIITLPGCRHNYGACANPGHLPYMEDNICFSGTLADHLRDASILQNGVVELGTDRKLLPVIRKTLDPSREAQIDANLALLELITQLYYLARQKSKNSLKERFELLCNEILRDISKWWSVREMAQFCGISESHFRSTFEEYSGIPPKLYIDRVKMGVAMEKLAISSIKITELAALLGYLDQYHFSRRFKALNGVSPSDFRLQRQGIQSPSFKKGKSWSK